NNTSSLSIEDTKTHLLKTYFNTSYANYNIDITLAQEPPSDTFYPPKKVIEEHVPYLHFDNAISSKTQYKAVIPTINNGYIHLSLQLHSILDLPELLRPKDDFKDYQYYD